MFQLAPILASFFGFFLRSVVYKAVLFGVILAAATVMLPWVLELMSKCACSAASLPHALDTLYSKFPAGAWWIIDLFNVGQVLPTLFCAWIARFIIRRIPVFG